MSKQVVKFKDEPHDGYVERYILGLNLLPDDSPEHGTSADPRIIFLREISLRHRVTTLIDNVNKIIGPPGEFVEFSPFDLIHLGFIGGEFVYKESASTVVPTSKANGFFSNGKTINEQDSIGKKLFSVLYSDALALFIEPTSSVLNASLTRFDSHLAHQEFIRKSVDLCSVVLTSRADGEFFVCYAKDKGEFNLLEGALEIAISTLKENSWFRANEGLLLWNDDYECLTS